MPYVALRDGERVSPWDVGDDTDVICPACRDAMYPRGGIGTHCERHFAHYPDSGDGCGGESDTHRRMKAVAAHAARQQYPRATVTIETKTGGVYKQRTADVLVDFADWFDDWGDGIAIECQHRHENKDLAKATTDHATAGYSTVFLHQSDFDGKAVRITDGDVRLWSDNWLPASEGWHGPNPAEQALSDTPAEALKNGAALTRSWHCGGVKLPIVWFNEQQPHTVWTAWFAKLVKARPDHHDHRQSQRARSIAPNEYRVERIRAGAKKTRWTDDTANRYLVHETDVNAGQQSAGGVASDNESTRIVRQNRYKVLALRSSFESKRLSEHDVVDRPNGQAVCINCGLRSTPPTLRKINCEDTLH